MTPSKRHTPPEQPAVGDDDLDGPTGAIRPHMRSLPLDARGAYLLSLVDGQCSVETSLDLCEVEVARAEALDALAHLLELAAIELRDP